MSKSPFSADYAGPPPEVKVDVPVEPEKAWAEREPLITEPGFYPNITPDEYFAEPCTEAALTNSLIQILAPEGAPPEAAAYRHPAIGQPAEEIKATKALHRGKLVHRLALGKGQDYTISPYKTYQSGEAKAWKTEIESGGVMPVKQAEFDEAEKMAAIIRPKIIEVCQGFPFETEVVIAWQEEVELIGGGHRTIWCRSMIDVWCESLMLAFDVKTCRSALDDALNKNFYNGWADQDFFYLRGLNKVTGSPGVPHFGFMAIESHEPHLHRIAHSTESFRHGAKINCERSMRIFATCLDRGVWPSYEPYAAYPTSWQLTQYTALEVAEISVYGLEGKK